MKTTLRTELGTLTAPPRREVADFFPTLAPRIAPSVRTAREYAELFVGMGRGPYMLVLKAGHPAAFLRFAERERSHLVSVHWSEDFDNGRTWWIHPTQEPDAYGLPFESPMLWGGRDFLGGERYSRGL